MSGNEPEWAAEGEVSEDGTRPLSHVDMNRMRVDAKDRLIWDGRLVQVQRRLTLTLWQTIFGVIVAFGALSQGALASVDLVCRFGWLGHGCGR